MSTERRALIALTLMSVGLVALLVTGVGSGWTALNVIGIACLAVAIAAQVVILRRVGSAGSRAEPRAQPERPSSAIIAD